MSKESAMAVATGSPAPAPTTTTTNGESTNSQLTEAPKSVSAGTEPELKSTPFSHLAKKEAEIVRQKQELKREQEANQAEKAKIADIKRQYEEYQATKSSDPVKALKMLGFSEADIFNYMAANTPVELSMEEKAIKAATEATEAKIKAFEEEQKKAALEAQHKSDQGLIQSYRSDVSKMIASNKEQFEYCNFHGKVAEDLIYETVLAVVKESKGEEVLTPKEAAELVESYYEEQDQLMGSLKKRQPKAAPQPEKSKEPSRSRTVTPGFPQATEAQPKPPVKHSRTLHQGATATVAATRQFNHESASQKRERLIERLRNGEKL